MREYYEVYINGQYHGSYDTYEEAESYANYNHGGCEIDIQVV